MARKIRFPLKMKNGAEVRTLDELKENFDLESVLGYFADGKLATWLSDRYYDEKAEAVSALSKDMPNLNAILCEIFGVEYKAETDETNLEEVQRRNEKLKMLSVLTADQHILNNIDIVAMNQDELFDILDEQPEKVYLYGEKFSIPYGARNIEYIGINNPVVELESGKNVYSYNQACIFFENVTFEKNANPIDNSELYEKSKGKNLPQMDSIVVPSLPTNTPSMSSIMPSLPPVTSSKISQDNTNVCHQAEENSKKDGYESKGEKLFLSGKYKEAFPLIKELAEGGNTRAMFIMSLYYGLGYNTVQIDIHERNKWLEISSKNGEPLSSYFIHENRNMGKANVYTPRYFSKLKLNKNDKNNLLHIIEKSAQSGDIISQAVLGEMFYYGYGTIESNKKEALSWLNKSAEKGVSYAQRALAIYYFDLSPSGWHQEHQDESYYWFKKAFDQGDAQAQFEASSLIGLFFDKSKYKTKEIEKELLTKSAMQGYPFAQCTLGMYYGGNFAIGIKKDDNKKFEWLRKAAKQDNAYAYKLMGDSYIRGEGVPKDINMALECFKQASEIGDYSYNDYSGLYKKLRAAINGDRSAKEYLWENHRYNV